MARVLQTPSLYSITPFDPINDYIIEFSYLDNQPEKNRLVIIDNDTDNTVYDTTILTKKLSHTIRANTLLAGHKYLAQIQVFDDDGNSSNLSEAILFYCFSRPEFYFKNIKDGDTYKSSSRQFDLVYSQSNGEKIKNVTYFQYSMDKSIISNSNTMYVTGIEIPSHIFYNLYDRTTYYFRAIGETINGMSLDTGFVELNISYEKIPCNVLFDVENNYCGGFINLKTNIYDVGYKLDNENYTLKDGSLFLTDNYIIYESGLQIDGDEDYKFFINASALKIGKFFNTNDNNVTLSVEKICSAYYCVLRVKNSKFVQYVSLPSPVKESNDDYYSDGILTYEIMRKNGYYGLKIYKNN